MRIEFPAVGGKQYSNAMTLSNAAPVKARVRTEILDFFVDENSTPQFVPEASSEAGHSCREWLTVNPMEMEIPPRTQVAVRFTVRVPGPVAEGSYHCAIGFHSLPAAGESGGLGVRTAVRVVSVLYPIVGKPPVNGEIRELKLEAVSNGPQTAWRGVVVMENSGPMLYRPQGQLDVVDSAGNVIESLQMISFPVLPMRIQRFLLPLKTALAPGRYTLRARVDLGSEIQEASETVTAESPGQ
jgi:hypothetical protein